MWKMKTAAKIALIVVAYFLLLPVMKIFVDALNSRGFSLNFDDVYFCSLIFVVVWIGIIWNKDKAERAKAERDS